MRVQDRLAQAGPAPDVACYLAAKTLAPGSHQLPIRSPAARAKYEQVVARLFPDRKLAPASQVILDKRQEGTKTRLD
jgi:hypothetical protein